MRLAILAAAILLSPVHCLATSVVAAGTRDCITAAAQHHNVNEDILRAIIWGESRMNPKATNTNDNGSVDVGAAQTNSIHFKELSRFNISREHLYDGCISVFVGAWMYSKHVAKEGNTWEAVGAYHSKTPLFQRAYANGVALTLAKWGKLPANWVPFPDAPRSTAAAIRLRKSQHGGAGPYQSNPKASRYASSIMAVAE